MSKRDLLKIMNAIKSRVNNPKQKQIVTIDGHIVLSEGERIVDDILYNNRILHCYNKDVIELGGNNRRVISDLFIPIINNKGIYIEYFGMLTDEYIFNKNEKISLYKKYNITLITIEKDEIKDVSTLTNRLLKEINGLKEYLFSNI